MNEPDSSNKKIKSLFICAGDHSADLHGGKLVRKLKEDMPYLKIWGLGGSSMGEAGMQLVYSREQLTVPIGIFEVIKHLPKLAAVREDLLNQILSKKPDVILLMDFGGFNLGFATKIKAGLRQNNIPDIPIVYFISPQIWGSRPWRINAILKSVNKMLVIFPFEEALYRQKKMSAKFVGHPLTMKFKAESERSTKEDFCQRNNLDPEKPIIGVFPGSRRQEIKEHASLVLQAIEWISRERSNVQFVIVNANQQMADLLQEFMQREKFIHLVGKSVKTISSEQSEDLMTHSDLLWTKSGTTTLEATLVGKPMLIFYRGSWLSFLLVMAFKIVKFVGWPNLLHGDGIVPELIQLDCRAEQLVRYTCDWLDVPGLRNEITAGLKTLKGHLGEGDFTDNARNEIIALLQGNLT